MPIPAENLVERMQADSGDLKIDSPRPRSVAFIRCGGCLGVIATSLQSVTIPPHRFTLKPLESEDFESEEVLQNLIQGSYWSWKTWKVMEFLLEFHFSGLESHGI